MNFKGESCLIPCTFWTFAEDDGMLHVQCELQCSSCISLAFRMHDDNVLQ